MHDKNDITEKRELQLYVVDYGFWVYWFLWVMFGSSWFWAIGLPLYIVLGWILNSYNGWVLVIGFWGEINYEKLRYCQTGGYPRCTLDLEAHGLWNWVLYPLRRFFI